VSRKGSSLISSRASLRKPYNLNPKPSHLKVVVQEGRIINSLPCLAQVREPDFAVAPAIPARHRRRHGHPPTPERRARQRKISAARGPLPPALRPPPCVTHRCLASICAVRGTAGTQQGEGCGNRGVKEPAARRSMAHRSDGKGGESRILTCLIYPTLQPNGDAPGTTGPSTVKEN
jgi:hypothetical protein